eukprot:750308-Hanusia_phi.AAC.6
MQVKSLCREELLRPLVDRKLNSVPVHFSLIQEGKVLEAQNLAAWVAHKSREQSFPRAQHLQHNLILIVLHVHVWELFLIIFVVAVFEITSSGQFQEDLSLLDVIAQLLHPPVNPRVSPRLAVGPVDAAWLVVAMQCRSVQVHEGFLGGSEQERVGQFVLCKVVPVDPGAAPSEVRAMPKLRTADLLSCSHIVSLILPPDALELLVSQ